MKFSIRDVLWLTALVAVTLALGLGWWRDRLSLQRENLKLQFQRDLHTIDLALPNS